MKKENMTINDTVQCLRHILPLDVYQAHTNPRSSFCEYQCPFQDAKTQECMTNLGLRLIKTKKVHITETVYNSSHMYNLLYN